MKDHTQKFLELLEHQQEITKEALDLLKLVYSQDAAEDSSSSSLIKKLDIHDGIRPLEAAGQLELYR